MDNYFDKEYTIRLYRLKKGCGSYGNIIIEIDGTFYNLKNGDEILVTTKIKKSISNLILQFGDGEKKLYTFAFTGDGDDFSIEFSINIFQRVIAKSANNTVCVF